MPSIGGVNVSGQRGKGNTEEHRINYSETRITAKESVGGRGC
ncbi:hypothetical protein [Acetonema longum]|nr:hypothetical protein [Acetonema longum]